MAGGQGFSQSPPDKRTILQPDPASPVYAAVFQEHRNITGTQANRASRGAT